MITPIVIFFIAIASGLLLLGGIILLVGHFKSNRKV